jgi:MYXO-CTERM domain-containing protein
VPTALLAALLGLGAADDAPVLEGCTCISLFGVRERMPLPANALHVVGFCDRGEPPLDRITAAVDSRPVRIVVEPEYLHERSFAFRLDPEPQEGQRVRIELCVHEGCRTPRDFYHLDYFAAARDVEPPALTGTPRIERSEIDPTDVDHCNRFPKVLVHAEGIDLGAESVTYMNVQMSGPAETPRGEVWRLYDDGDWNDSLPVEIDAYSGRWCADVTLLDAAGNARPIGSDCEIFSCSCRTGSRPPVPALLMLFGLVAVRIRRRTS